jgi:hypothetical protein
MGHHSGLRVMVVVSSALLLGPVLPTPALAQWPTALMFYGDGLAKPVIIAGSDSVVVAPAFRPATPGPGATTASSMGARPYVNVACFWGPPSDPAMNGVRALADLTPDMAWQHARFYPATRGHPAVVFVTALTKVRPGQHPVVADAAGAFYAGGPLSAAGLAVLRRAGVPVGRDAGP